MIQSALLSLCTPCNHGIICIGSLNVFLKKNVFFLQPEYN